MCSENYTREESNRAPVHSGKGPTSCGVLPKPSRASIFQLSAGINEQHMARAKHSVLAEGSCSVPTV